MTLARRPRAFAASMAVLFLLTGVESAFGVHACGIHALPAHGSVPGPPAGAGGHHHGDPTDDEAADGEGAEIAAAIGEASDECDHHGTGGEGESCTCPGTCHVASGAAIPSEAAPALAPRSPLVVEHVATRPVFERRHPPFFLPYSQAPPRRI